MEKMTSLFGLACHYTFRSTPIDLAPQGNVRRSSNLFKRLVSHVTFQRQHGQIQTRQCVSCSMAPHDKSVGTTYGLTVTVLASLPDRCI